jgi:hypothetical protein
MPPDRHCHCGGTGWDGCPPDDVAAAVSAPQSVALRNALAHGQTTRPSLTDHLLAEVQNARLRRLLSTSPEPAEVVRRSQPQPPQQDMTPPAALPSPSLSITDLLTQPTNERK